MDGYAAFISYSHADEKIARWLHRKLEAYRTPRPLAAQQGRHGPIPRRLGRIFRDREEFAAGGDLKAEIQAALGRSTALIVLCSARSKASRYVNAEIQHFRELGRADRIIPVILDGEPADCFPDALNDGVERLGADFRDGRDEREGGLMKILAGLLGVGVDEIVRREQAAQRARARLFAGAAAAFAGLAAAAVFFAVQSARNEQTAERRAAILSIDTANSELANGRTEAALLILLEASRTFARETPPDSLLIAFDAALRRATSETEYALPAGALLFDAPNGAYIADPATGEISLLTASGAPAVIARAGGAPAFVAAAPDGALFVVRDDYAIERHVQGQAVDVIGQFAPAGLAIDRTIGTSPVSLTPDGSALVLQGADQDDARTQIFDIAARTLRTAPFATIATVGVARDPDGVLTAFDAGDHMARLDAPYDAESEVAWPDAGPDYGAMAARLCLGEAAPQPMAEAFARIANEWSAGPVRTACRSSGSRALYSSYMFTSGGGRRDNFLIDDFGETTDISAWVGAEIARGGGYLSGPIVGDFAGGDLSWIDLVGDGGLALTANRDLLIAGAGPAFGELMSRRFPSEITYARVLDAETIAVVDADTPRVSIIRFGAPFAYASAAPAAAPTLMRRSVCSSEEALEGTAPDGARLRIALTATLSGETESGAETELTVTRTANGETRARAFEMGDEACAELSANLAYLALPSRTESERLVYDLGAGDAAPIGRFEVPLWGDLSFIGDGPAVLIAEGGNVVSRRDLGADGQWRRAEIYRGDTRVATAESDPDGRRLLLLEDLGGSTMGGALYSLEARQVWRRFGTEYKWFSVHFTDTGEVAQERHGALEAVTHLHQLTEAIAAARAALPERCRNFNDENYSRSACWPATLRE